MRKIIFSSFEPSMIDLSRAKSKGHEGLERACSCLAEKRRDR